MPPKKKYTKTKLADDSEAENMGEDNSQYVAMQQQVKLGSFSR